MERKGNDMNANTSPKTIDQEGNEIVPSRADALGDRTLAVAIAEAELERKIVTAHKFPRSIDVVLKKIRTFALYNKDAAENAIYALPRGGKPILGPSIGFANIVIQAWSNAHAIARPVGEDLKRKVVIAEGLFTDLESNTTSGVTVERRIVDSRGRIYSDDMKIVTGMAAQSIARRNAILQGVPRSLWHPIYLEALQVVRGDHKTFAENKEAAFKALATFGVKPEQVFGLLGIKGDADLTLEHIPTLRGCFAALRDGSATVQELFDPRRMAGRPFDPVRNPLGAGGDDDGPSDDLTAGMGEPAAAAAEPEAPEPAPQTTTQKVTPAASAPAEAAGAPAPEAAATVAPAAAAAPAASQAAPAADAKLPLGDGRAEPAEPANAEQYVEHWRAMVADLATESAIKNQWGAERQLRKNCNMLEDDLDKCNAARDARLAQIRGGKK